MIEVGSLVRASKAGKRCRATVATILPEDDSAELLWEDLAPKSYNKPFRICPSFPSKAGEEEAVVPLSDIESVLEFEGSGSSVVSDANVAISKDRADTLLRLGDPSAAVSYYEQAISASTEAQIGSTIIFKGRKASPVLAEVDCIEEKSADVTLVETQEEQTIPLSQIILCILPGQESLLLRVLLNLARCLMQLAEMDIQPRRPQYRESAVFACSLALTMPGEGEKRRLETALLIRSRAQAARGKWQAATKDVDMLLQHNPTHKEGRAWRNEMHAKMADVQKSNRKLAKTVCEWVQSSMNKDNEDEGGEPVSPSTDSTQEAPEQPTPSRPLSSWMTTLLWNLIFPIILTLLIHRLIVSYVKTGTN